MSTRLPLNGPAATAAIAPARRRALPLALAALLLPATLPAQDTAEDRAWDGTGELGFVSSSGNSRSDSINARLGLKYEDGDWRHSLSLSGLRQRGETTVLSDPDDPGSGTRLMQTTANRYEIGTQAARKLNERNAVYASLRYENDDFAPYDYQAIVATGWAHTAIDTERTTLTLEGGPGYKRTREALTGETEGNFIGRGKLDFQTRLTQTTSLVDTLLVETGSDNTFIQNDLGVRVAISSQLALKAGLQHRHNTDVPEGRSKTDRMTTLNLVYDF